MNTSAPPYTYVPSTVVVGSHGQSVVTRGYMQIGDLRIYDDQIIVGPQGQRQISNGWSEVSGVRIDDTNSLETESRQSQGRHGFYQNDSERWL